MKSCPAEAILKPNFLISIVTEKVVVAVCINENETTRNAYDRRFLYMTTSRSAVMLVCQNRAPSCRHGTLLRIRGAINRALPTTTTYSGVQTATANCQPSFSAKIGSSSP